MQQQVTTVHTDKFKAIGPYSAAKIVAPTAHLVYLSGQLGIVPETGNLISEDVAEQATQAMKNVGILLEAAKSSFKNVVKCIVYLVDMADFAKVNEAYAKFFDGDYPARVCIAVKQLPKGGLVEVEVIAVQDTEQ
ncbi:unnamed protein product [Paramecium octaurelia]|uniref:Uncharacterized protein n=1 Tax=Paramecium octaurelia TaxID=43137 RepID=A0A8S1WVJ6_PAROT|nr:unnamed protein product [Paramecium octaurelia]